MFKTGPASGPGRCVVEKCRVSLLPPAFMNQDSLDLFMSALSNIQCSIGPLKVVCDSSCAAESGNLAARSANSSVENAKVSAACGSSWIKASSAAARCASTVAASPRTPPVLDALSCICPCNCKTLLFRARTCAALSLSSDEPELAARPWPDAPLTLKTKQITVTSPQLPKRDRL